NARRRQLAHHRAAAEHRHARAVPARRVARRHEPAAHQPRPRVRHDQEGEGAVRRAHPARLRRGARRPASDHRRAHRSVAGPASRPRPDRPPFAGARPPHDGLDERRGPEAHGIGGGERGVARGALYRGPRRRFAQVERIEADPDHLRRAHRGGRALVQLDQLGQRGDLHPGLAAVIVADPLPRRLVAEDQRVRAAAVQQAERDARVAGVHEAALSLDQHDVRVRRGPEHEAALDRRPQPAAPLRRQLTARGRDAHEHRRGTEGQALREVSHHRDAAAEAEHILDGLAALRAIEHRHDPLGEVADAGVRGLRCERAELPVRDDQEAVALGGGREHHAEVWVFASVPEPRNSPLARSTAGSRWVASPYSSPCTMCRTNTIDTASTGTATTSPMAPSSVPITSTLAIVSTGGSATFFSMMRGAMRFASKKCTATPQAATASACSQLPVPSTNSAGSRVDTRVPKKGTIATSPVKMPNASQYGTRSTHRPTAVKTASTTIASSWPTTQARRVAPASSSTRSPTWRCWGETSDRMPSR